jgi:hypothetical protein
MLGDACLQPRAYCLRETDYLPWLPETRDEHSFARVQGVAGLGLKWSEYFSGRAELDPGDIAGKPLTDLYAEGMWRNLSLRLGQFRLPTGYENLAPPRDLDFIDYTLLSGQCSPTGGRWDIGAQLGYTHHLFQTALAVTNGAGRNQPRDNNRFKDIAWRAMASPFGSASPVFAGGNFYLGSDTSSRDTFNRPFRRYAAEVGVATSFLFLRAEYVKGQDGAGGVNGFHASGGFRVGAVQPVVRFERLVAERPNLPVSVFTVGLNGYLAQDMVKPMFNLSWTSDRIQEHETLKLAFQLQAAFW